MLDCLLCLYLILFHKQVKNLGLELLYALLKVQPDGISTERLGTAIKVHFLPRHSCTCKCLLPYRAPVLRAVEAYSDSRFAVRSDFNAVNMRLL